MNIQELDSYNLADAVKFNDRLNPKLWGDGERLRPEVRERLLEIAEDFKEFLGISDIELKDITVSGSNAAYAYTPKSDIDLHLVVDLPQADHNEVYRELFDAKKYQYNEMHNIKIGGYDVELYVQDANQPHISQGIYSVLNDKWLSVPKRRKPQIDDISVKSKYEDLGHRIESAIASDDLEKITSLTEKIREYRQAGLDAHGEFGPENLAFKILRNQGLIKKLYDARNAAKDQQLSLKETPKKKFTYGFKEDATLTPDGVSPETCMFLDDEQPEPSDEEILKDFIDFCFKELKLERMPTIKLRRDPQWPVVHKTFGRYIDDRHMLEVAFGQRHIMDVLRTVAHELTHKHQHERENVPPSAGETGSEYENEANARAGILMRDYARLHPEYFAKGQAHNIKVDEGASGYIPTKAQAKDPRYSMALTVDIKPGQVGKEANKLGLKTDKQGHPQIAKASGLVEALTLEFAKFKKAHEDYSPDHPPGPESKPTMPKGTVRVDVSDIYDWYKLGKNISNLKAVDKNTLSKGPPSTIVSFGDEDTEHKYIKDLENIGLSTTDIDPLDPRQPKGMKRQKVDPTYNVNESQLDEVRMAPSNLKQFAMSPEAEGIQAGFEAELIFRDALNDDDGEDMEPDYDMDERCRSIQQVIDFFNNGEYGGLSQRQESALQNGLDEQYFEWQDEKMYDAFRDEAPDLVRDIWLEERPWDERIHDALVEGVGVTDQEADAIVKLHDQRAKGEIKGSEMSEEQLDMVSQYSEAKSIADDILDEDVQSSIDKQDGYYDQALDEFRNDFYVDDDSGFFDDIGLRWMSDVAEGYDLDWPYLTGSSNGGSRDWEEIGDSLNKAIDMPVKVSSGYHSATRKPGLWIVEPDSSLDPDDRDDYGLEIVSPPMPLAQALEKLQEVTDWANSDEGNAYTNSSTGLHMGVSIPYKEGRVDYLKLLLFLGDEYVLQQYGREANTYTKAAMREIKQRAGTEKNATAVLELLKNNLLELAERELAKNTGEGKYTSAHKQGKYIEFRSAGGDWLAEDNAEPGKLENTMMRYAYAMYLAGRPDLERREYAKKLYKLVAGGADDSTMALFSQYAAGELDKEQLKKRWAEKTLSKEAPKEIEKGEWIVIDNSTKKPVQGQSYNGYTKDEVRARAKQKLSPASSDTDFDLAYSVEPQNTGRWEVYRDDQGQDEQLEIIDAPNRGEAVDRAYDTYTNVIPYKVRPYYGDQPATPEKELSPRAKLAKRIVKPKPQQEPAQQSTNTNPTVQDAGQVRMPNGMPVWEVYDKETGSIVNQLADHTMREAHSRMMAWLQSIGAEDPATYVERFGVRPKMLQAGEQNLSPTIRENFADGKGPGRPGDSQRHGIPKGATIAQLEKAAKAPGRKGQLARWQLNMRRGKKK